MLEFISFPIFTHSNNIQTTLGTGADDLCRNDIPRNNGRGGGDGGSSVFSIWVKASVGS